MATELLALAAGADSAGRILTATDRKNTEFLDVLIENEQKEVIAHTVVQRYLQVIHEILFNTAITFDANLLTLLFSWWTGIMARRTELVRVSTSAATHCVHHLPARLGDFYASVRPQIQQSSNHQIHVLLDVAYISDAAFDDCRHNAVVCGAAPEPVSLLVRMGIADMAERIIALRTDQSER